MAQDYLDVSDTEPRIYYTVGGTPQTAFDVPFVFYDESDLKVYLDDVLQTLGSDYTVTGAEDEDGGTVTFSNAVSNAGVGIVLDIAIALDTHIPSHGPLDIAGINIQFSRFISILRQIQSLNRRTIRLADSDEDADLEAPALVERKGRMFGWDAITGEPIVTANTLATLDDLLSGALNAQAGLVSTVVTANYTSLRAIAPAANSVVFMRGYTGNLDGAEGFFYWDAASSATHNGATIIQPAAGGVGRWKRVYEKGIVHVDWFGPAKNGVTDDLSKLQAARDLLVADGGGILQFGYGQYRISNTFAYEAVNNVPITIRGVVETGTEILMASTGFAIQYYGTTGAGNEARGGGVENLKISKTGGGTCSGIDIANVYRGTIKNNETTGCGDTGIRVTGRGGGDQDATAGTKITQNRCRSGLIGIQVRGDTSGSIVAAEIEITSNNCDGNYTCGVWLANVDKVVVEHNTIAACGDGNNGVYNKRGQLFVEYFGIHVKNVICRYNEFGNSRLGAIQNVVIDALIGGTFAHNRHVRSSSEYGTGAYSLGFSQTSQSIRNLLFDREFFNIEGASAYYAWNAGGTTMVFAQNQINMPQYNAFSGGAVVFNGGTPIGVGINEYNVDTGHAKYGIVEVHASTGSVVDRTGTDGAAVTIQRGGLTVGSITVTSSATAYNTSSDEKFKRFLGLYDPSKAADIIRRDPVRDFMWDTAHGGGRAVGWGAQTSYAVSEDLATPGGWFNKKTGLPSDERDADAEYHSWGVDQSKRTPYLWAAVGMLLDQVDALKEQLAELQGRGSAE